MAVNFKVALYLFASIVSLVDEWIYSFTNFKASELVVDDFVCNVTS